MIDNLGTDNLHTTVSAIAGFYDACKYGREGTEGYRKSTDLSKLACCIEDLAEKGFIGRERTIFADLGCADGRVNILMSYFVRLSIGIEIDADILGEYHSRRKVLDAQLSKRGLILPPDNINVFCGSSIDPEIYENVRALTGIGFEDVDLFYTYITLHDVFSEKIVAEAKPGAFYLVYGFNRILPRYGGLEVVIPDVGRQGIAALYMKPKTAQSA